MADKKLELKPSVRLATESNAIQNLSQAPLIFDSVSVAVGDRILVKNGASLDGFEPISDKRNGIYEVNSITDGSAELVRAKDANRNIEVVSGMFTFVNEGASNKNTGWLLITDNPIDLDTTDLQFIKFSGSGEVSADTQKAIDRNVDNIALLSFRQQTLNSLNLASMVDGRVDEYEDETLVDNVASIDEQYDSVNDLYFNQDENTRLLLHLNGTNGQLTTVDSSIFANTITLLNGAKLSTVNKEFGSASLLLDGINDAMRAGNQVDFKFVHGADNPTGFKWTIDFWLQVNDFALTRSIMSNINNTNSVGFALTINADRSLRMSIVRGVAATTVIDSTSIAGIYPNDSNFHHIAFTYDQSLASDNLKIYVDGIESHSGTKTGNTPSTANATNPLAIGSNASVNTLFIDGSYDELRISDVIRYTGNFTPETSEYTANANMTLISEPFTALAEASNGRIMVFKEDLDTIILNTDLKAFISRDDGVTYSEITLIDRGQYTNGQNIAGASVDISSQPSGTQMRYKIETLNNKGIKIHGTGLFWD